MKSRSATIIAAASVVAGLTVIPFTGPAGANPGGSIHWGASSVTADLPPCSQEGGCSWELSVDEPFNGNVVIGIVYGSSGSLTVQIPPFCGVVQADLYDHGRYDFGHRMTYSTCEPPTTTTTVPPVTTTTVPTPPTTVPTPPTTKPPTTPPIVVKPPVPPAPPAPPSVVTPATPQPEQVTAPVVTPSSSPTAATVPPHLAYTGAPVGRLLGLGSGLVLFGLGLLLPGLRRRRRTA